MDSADLARQEYFLDTNPIIRSKQEKKFTESIDLFEE
jgi:hypothetical protein